MPSTTRAFKSALFFAFDQYQHNIFHALMEWCMITALFMFAGIDVSQVSIVINYDPPMTQDKEPDFETYLHRIGRTGRFGKAGIAINFCDSEAAFSVIKAIEAHFGRLIFMFLLCLVILRSFRQSHREARHERCGAVGGDRERLKEKIIIEKNEYELVRSCCLWRLVRGAMSITYNCDWQFVLFLLSLMSLIRKCSWFLLLKNDRNGGGRTMLGKTGAVPPEESVTEFSQWFMLLLVERRLINWRDDELRLRGASGRSRTRQVRRPSGRAVRLSSL